VIDRAAHRLTPVDFAQDVPVRMGDLEHRFSLMKGELPDTDLPIYFVDSPGLLHRGSIYTSDPDEPHRFALFSHAVLLGCQRMGWAPHVVHANDWHTALIPLLLKTVYEWDALFATTKNLVTVHNLGYQGQFDVRLIEELGLGPWLHLFDQDDTRGGRVNFLRTGLLYADVVSTVSPSYAQEIQTDVYGMGLQQLLRARRETLIGILNGADYDEWSPEKDRFIPHRFSLRRLEGKRKNKLHLMRELGLADAPEAPLLGIVSRLAHQKGFELTFEVLPHLLSTSDLRVAVLGSGEKRYEEFFEQLQHRFPQRVVYYRGYSDELAHLIEAGADMFLMPSRYEPCGLNQLFSLRYGTIPIVRATGGLRDSVQPFDETNGQGTGFLFDDFSPRALSGALDQALKAYRDPERWRLLIENAMSRDYSWDTQAKLYVELYARMAA
jgi:starch synthase